ncbi:VanZ family protein [Cellulomonas sp. URHD0024]|uniref:VanZ family protein n=1 Tax=Cellulomonas sp. URHD0024 TaxID=1302620 RepID=UPI00041ADC41|nr:VanZ family protein [Cellulomonas sp. URHD0024]
MPQPATRRAVVVTLVLYLGLVARITLWPAPSSSGLFFDLVDDILTWFLRAGVPLSFSQLEASANVVMFVPFGVLVGLLVRRRWLVVVLGLCLSAAIELTQLLFFPTRVPSIRDVVMNTLGATIGLLGLQAARSINARRRAGTAEGTTG